MRYDVPRDGWVRIEPGGVYKTHTQRPVKPGIMEMRDFVNDVRGRILSLAYDVEYDLERVLEAYVLGPQADDEPDARRVFFREELSAELALGRKVTLTKRIARQFEAADQAGLGELLDRIVQARNALAHGVTWFEPVLDPDGFAISLLAYLRHKTRTWELSPAQRDDWLEAGQLASVRCDYLVRLLGHRVL